MPYHLYSLFALVQWTYFSNSVGGASGSLVGNAHMLSKVYFPRMILPLAASLSTMVDFLIALTISLGIVLFSGLVPNAKIITAMGLIMIIKVCVLVEGIVLSQTIVFVRWDTKE